jgi:hypothetical protein
MEKPRVHLVIAWIQRLLRRERQNNTRLNVVRFAIFRLLKHNGSAEGVLRRWLARRTILELSQRLHKAIGQRCQDVEGQEASIGSLILRA